MSKKGILVSYMGPQRGVDLSGMAKDATRLTTGPILYLARRCTRTLSEDELAYIEENHKDVAKLLTKHSARVDPEAKAKKKASRDVPRAPEGASMRPPKPLKKKGSTPPPPPPPPSDAGGKDGDKKGKGKGNKPS